MAGVRSGWTRSRGTCGWLVRSFSASRSNSPLGRSNQSQSQRCCFINLRLDVESARLVFCIDLTTYSYLPAPTPAPLNPVKSAVNSVVRSTSAFGTKAKLYAIIPSLRRRTKPPPAHGHAFSSLPSVQPLSLPTNTRLSICLSVVEQRPSSASWSCCASDLTPDNLLAAVHTDTMPRPEVMVLAERLRY